MKNEPRPRRPSDAQLKELQALMDAISTPTTGQLVVSGQDVLLTCAYYVGSWCSEWMGDGWLPQPYSRDTEYMGSFEEAKRMLDSFEADEAEEIECTWCGGECYTTYANRRNELFCSKNHRDASNRALKRFLSKSEEIA